jgi:hypothetical protein
VNLRVSDGGNGRWELLIDLTNPLLCQGFVFLDNLDGKGWSSVCLPAAFRFLSKCWWAKIT